MAEDPKIFISYAAADSGLALAFANFIQLGCNLREEQVFLTARPSVIPKGTLFVEAIRQALEEADLAVLLLTPAYYESHFCLAELGAIWVRRDHRVPIVVPPLDYASLDGVQLGEQAIRLTSTSGLDELRDAVKDVLASEVSTSSWNGHKTDFLNKWDTELSGKITEIKKVDVAELDATRSELVAAKARIEDLSADAQRLRQYSQQLATQNSELRQRVQDAPPPPELEGDENAQYIAEAQTAIERAADIMDGLPTIVKEALFQMFHDGQALTVGGYADTFGIETAREQEELGRLKWVEDEQQQVWPREEGPGMNDAFEALARVRELAFDGVSHDSRNEAGDWIKPYLKEKFEITDPVFELRPVWEALGLL